MGRPKKSPGALKSEILNIPVTTEQKRLIVEAALAGGRPEFTTWARDILIAAAKRQLREHRKRGNDGAAI